MVVVRVKCFGQRAESNLHEGVSDFYVKEDTEPGGPEAQFAAMKALIMGKALIALESSWRFSASFSMLPSTKQLDT